MKILILMIFIVLIAIMLQLIFTWLLRQRVNLRKIFCIFVAITLCVSLPFLWLDENITPKIRRWFIKFIRRYSKK